MPPHLPRLSHALHELLRTRRTAALGTLDASSGAPSVSMVPFAIDAHERCIVLHLSGLAAHTTNLLADARASLLIAAPEVPGAPVHDLPRTVQAAEIAQVLAMGTDDQPPAGA